MQDARKSSEAPTFHRASTLDDLAAARASALRRIGPRPHPAPADRRSPLIPLLVTTAVGVALSVGGAGLLAASFSHTFMEPNPDPAWEEAGAAGAFLFVCGAVLTVTSIVASVVAGLRRLNRRERGG